MKDGKARKEIQDLRGEISSLGVRVKILEGFLGIEFIELFFGNGYHKEIQGGSLARFKADFFHLQEENQKRFFSLEEFLNVIYMETPAKLYHRKKTDKCLGR
jgi:hypothetical protein